VYKDDEDDGYNYDNDLALRQTDSTEGANDDDDDDDDDDPWVLTDVTRFVNTRKGGGMDQEKRPSIVPIQHKARVGEGQ